jgi:hypothetical protein
VTAGKLIAAADPIPLSKAQADYALKYGAARKARVTQHQGVFLPLEFLIDRASGESFLSVSLSGTGALPIYITRNASLYRIVRLTVRWLVLPATISKVFTPAEFESSFSRFLGSARIDGEEFWRIPAASVPSLREAIAGQQLDNGFREIYSHGYLPE